MKLVDGVLESVRVLNELLLLQRHVATQLWNGEPELFQVLGLRDDLCQAGVVRYHVANALLRVCTPVLASRYI